ncbi:MAG: peptidase M15 [Pseudomonadota bacterium]
MRKPESVKTLENLGRVALSPNFFMRDFLYSEIAQIERIPNVPDFPDRAIAVGKELCTQVLEPIQARFGKISIRSAYRAPAVNEIGAANKNQYNCSRNEANYGEHIWDYARADGSVGATACIVVNRFVPYFERTGDWSALAWWIHDQVPGYSKMFFFPKLAAFNISWSSAPIRRIDSYVPPKGCLTQPGYDNHGGSHASAYRDLLEEIGG